MVLLLSDLDDSEKKSCKEADNADTPDPEEAVLDMVFDLYICEADTKECCRYNRADECCTVTADYHNNSDVCRNYTVRDSWGLTPMFLLPMVNLLSIKRNGKRQLRFLL